MANKNERILVIAAHPDDEVLGCGATIARLAREGREVYIAILGEGATSRCEKGEKADWKLVEQLHAASRQAATLLGAKDLFMHSLPDNMFDTVPLLDVVKIVEGLVGRLQPAVVYTHHGGDLNIDHCITSRAVLTATRPVAGCPVRELLMFEVPSSTEWAFQRLEPVFRPTVFTDVHGTIDAKIQAMELYEGEMRAFPHPRSALALRASAQRWGSVAGMTYAEAFELVRSIR
jgi:LmbE family N-acetylglucosaminyl deacetylase